jgi:MFS family permease
MGSHQLEAGLAFLPLSLVLMVAAGLASAVVGRFGVRGALVPGLLLLALGLLLLSRVPVEGSFLGDLLLPEMVVAVGLGLSFVSLTVAAVSGVEGGESGLASGLINTTLQVGGAVGLAALAAVAGATTAGTLASGGTEIASLVAGYRAAFLFGAGVALVGALLAFVLLRNAGPDDPKAKISS